MGRTLTRTSSRLERHCQGQPCCHPTIHHLCQSVTICGKTICSYVDVIVVELSHERGILKAVVENPMRVILFGCALLLASCTDNTDEAPSFSQDQATPVPTVLPSVLPSAPPSTTPQPSPTSAATPAPIPSVSPSPMPSIAPTTLPSLTPTPAASPSPSPVDSKNARSLYEHFNRYAN